MTLPLNKIHRNFLPWLFTILAAVVTLPAARADGPSTYPPPGYSKVWSDEFDGAELDTSKWFHRTDVKMQSSQRSGNVSVENGNLVIGLKKESHRGKGYSGGGVISRDRFRYGYFEARVKMHGGSGWHQSVWAMYGAPETTYPSQMYTEIDGMEFDSDVLTKGHMGLLRWNGPGQSRGSTCTPGVYRGPLGFNGAEDYHVYGFEWTEKEVRYYLDGDLRCVLAYPPPEGRHDRINFWLTAIAYERLSGKLDDSRLPGRMLVDHAAVYRKNVYIDDGEPGYGETGQWSSVDGAGFSGAGYWRSCEGAASAAWRSPLPAGGRYEVFLFRHLQRGTGGEAVVGIGEGQSALRRELSFVARPAGWTSLGTFQSGSGVEASVTLTRVSGCIAADMMKFVKVQRKFERKI